MDWDFIFFLSSSIWRTFTVSEITEIRSIVLLAVTYSARQTLDINTSIVAFEISVSIKRNWKLCEMLSADQHNRLTSGEQCKCKTRKTSTSGKAPNTWDNVFLKQEKQTLGQPHAISPINVLLCKHKTLYFECASLHDGGETWDEK